MHPLPFRNGLKVGSARGHLGLLLAVVAGSWLAGCAGEDTETAPPLFNAIDPSMQCPAGRVGWDFSTGGNEPDVVFKPVSQEEL